MHVQASQPLATPLRLSLRRAPVPGIGFEGIGGSAVVRHDVSGLNHLMVPVSVSASAWAAEPPTLPPTTSTVRMWAQHTALARQNVQEALKMRWAELLNGLC